MSKDDDMARQMAERYEILREYVNPKELHEELRNAGKLPGYKWEPPLHDEHDPGEELARRVDELLDWVIDAQAWGDPDG